MAVRLFDRFLRNDTGPWGVEETSGKPVWCLAISQEEAQTWTVIQGKPGVPGILAQGEEDGQYWLILALAPGSRPLGEWLSKTPLTWEKAWRLGRDLLVSLKEAGPHGALGPESVLFSDEGEVQVVGWRGEETNDLQAWRALVTWSLVGGEYSLTHGELPARIPPEAKTLLEGEQSLDELLPAWEGLSPQPKRIPWIWGVGVAGLLLALVLLDFGGQPVQEALSRRDWQRATTNFNEMIYRPTLRYYQLRGEVEEGEASLAHAEELYAKAQEYRAREDWRSLILTLHQMEEMAPFHRVEERKALIALAQAKLVGLEAPQEEMEEEIIETQEVVVPEPIPPVVTQTPAPRPAPTPTPAPAARPAPTPAPKPATPAPANWTREFSFAELDWSGTVEGRPLSLRALTGGIEINWDKNILILGEGGVPLLPGGVYRLPRADRDLIITITSSGLRLRTEASGSTPVVSREEIAQARSLYQVSKTRELEALFTELGAKGRVNQALAHWVWELIHDLPPAAPAEVTPQTPAANRVIDHQRWEISWEQHRGLLLLNGLNLTIHGKDYDDTLGRIRLRVLEMPLTDGHRESTQVLEMVWRPAKGEEVLLGRWGASDRYRGQILTSGETIRFGLPEIGARVVIAVQGVAVNPSKTVLEATKFTDFSLRAEVIPQ